MAALNTSCTHSEARTQSPGRHRRWEAVPHCRPLGSLVKYIVSSSHGMKHLACSGDTRRGLLMHRAAALMRAGSGKVTKPSGEASQTTQTGPIDAFTRSRAESLLVKSSTDDVTESGHNSNRAQHDIHQIPSLHSDCRGRGCIGVPGLAEQRQRRGSRGVCARQRARRSGRD